MNSIYKAISIYKMNSQFDHAGSQPMLQNFNQKKDNLSLNTNDMKKAFDKILKEKMKKNLS